MRQKKVFFLNKKKEGNAQILFGGGFGGAGTVQQAGISNMLCMISLSMYKAIYKHSVVCDRRERYRGFLVTILRCGCILHLTVSNGLDRAHAPQ